MQFDPLHIVRASLYERLERRSDAVESYEAALRLDPPQAEATFIKAELTRIRRSARDGPDTG